MNFILGCNYWASNAGIEMWRNFDADTIKKDLNILSLHGVRYLRVFPLWRDFQPVKPNFSGQGRIEEYVMEDGHFSENSYFLDETMLDRFSNFLDICDSYNIKIIVGIITGWMSGGLFIPSALYGKNILTDSTALYFEQLFVKGFVERFKSRKTIYAWDLGNECNCVAEVDNNFSAAAWTATISNAIHSADGGRPVISGMHSLTLDGNWRIEDQARFTDILTTHPYPLWCRHTTIDETLSLRTTMHATAETKWYSDIGNKPCFAEEIGTMGPMVCSNERAADFLRLNMFSLWANGSEGVMWWCNHDQNLLETFPYTVNMIEQELGLIDSKQNPKPALSEIKKFADFLAQNDIDLPKPQENGVCLLTKDTDHWGVAYMTYILAKKIGLNLKFSYSYEQAIPNSNLYLLPSINGMAHMHKKNFEALKQKVFNGADLYISMGDAFLQGFEELVGLKVIDTCIRPENSTVNIENQEIPVFYPSVRKYVPTSADILATDKNGNPFATVNKYGKGRVVFVAAPIENNLINTPDAFSGKTEKIYEIIFKEHIKKIPIRVNSKDVVFTNHPDKNGMYLVAINHSDTEKALNIETNGNYTVEKIIYGNLKTIRPFDSCIIRFKSQK